MSVVRRVANRLSGLSPFYRETAKDTLLAARDGQWSFVDEAFTGISADAKDFISKLLTKDPQYASFIFIIIA